MRSRIVYVNDFGFNLPPRIRHLFRIKYKLKEPIQITSDICVNECEDTELMDNFQRALRNYVESHGYGYKDWSPLEMLDFDSDTGYCQVRINSKVPLKKGETKDFIKNYFSGVEKLLNRQLEKYGR